MKKIEAIIRPERVNNVKDALADAGFFRLMTTQVTGRGAQRGVVHMGRSGQTTTVDMLQKVKLEMVASAENALWPRSLCLPSRRCGCGLLPPPA